MKLRAKISYHILSRREILISATVVLLIFLGTFQPIFSIAAFALCCLAMFFMDNTYFISLLFLLLPIAGIFKLSPGSMSLFTYLELLYILWHNYRKKFRLSTGELLALLFFAYLFITSMAAAPSFSSVPFTDIIKSTVNLLLIGYFAEINIDRDNRKLYLYFIAGVLISSVITLMDCSLFPISKYIVQKTETFQQLLSVVRFSGLYGDPNYFSINAIVAMCLTVILYRLKKLNFLCTGILVAGLLIFIGMTGSKSSFLMLVIPVMLMLYVCAKNRNYTALLLCVLAIFAIILLVQIGVITVFDYVLLRLSNTGTSTEAFTTGRSAIWEVYMAYLLQTPLQLIFGNGSYTYTLYGFVAHSTYLDFLYQLGIVGTALYWTTVFQLVKKIVRPIKRCPMNYCICLIIAVMYFFLSELLCSDLPFHLALIFIVYNEKIADPHQKHKIYVIKNTKPF